MKESEFRVRFTRTTAKILDMMKQGNQSYDSVVRNVLVSMGYMSKDGKPTKLLKEAIDINKGVWSPPKERTHGRKKTPHKVLSDKKPSR